MQAGGQRGIPSAAAVSQFLDERSGQSPPDARDAK
jgi:hypothetical protein